MTRFTTTGLAIVLATTPAYADQVTITGLNWDSAKVISEIITQVADAELDVPVRTVEGVTDDALVSMDAGDGTYDIFPDFWLPNQQAAWNTYVNERGTIKHNTPYEAEQGFYLLSKTADTLALANIYDLNNPDVAAQFDTDGDGLGEYWAGEASWGAPELNQIRMASYGLGELWEPWIAPNDDLKQALAEAGETGRPLLFYHWTPEWVFGAYDLAQLAEPAYYDGCKETYKSQEREDWLEASRFECAFETSTVHIIYSASLEQRFPRMAELLSRMTFTPEMINGWVLETGVNGSSPDAVAAAWIADNPQIVSSWLSGTVTQ